LKEIKRKEEEDEKKRQQAETNKRQEGPGVSISLDEDLPPK
jgi:hypothetical protein